MPARVPPRRIVGRAGYWLWLLGALVVVAVAQRRLGPSSSTTISTTERAAVLSGPAPLLQPAHDHNPAALAQRFGRMLGLVAPHHDGEERRLLLAPA